LTCSPHHPQLIGRLAQNREETKYPCLNVQCTILSATYLGVMTDDRRYLNFAMRISFSQMESAAFSV